MGVRLLKEYRKETNEAIKKYEEHFNSDFPTYHYEFNANKEKDFEEEIIEVINKCIKNNKDVYKSGYLNFDDDLTCY